MSLSPESSFLALQPDASSSAAMSSSTPPTTVADSASIHSDVSKHEHGSLDVDTSLSTPVADDADESLLTQATDTPTSARSRRERRVSAPVYNLAKLSGTSGHGKRLAKGDAVSERNRNRRRRTIARAMELATERARLEDEERREDEMAEAQVQAEFSERIHAQSLEALNLQPSPLQAPRAAEPPKVPEKGVSSPKPSEASASPAKKAAAKKAEAKKAASRRGRPPKPKQATARPAITKHVPTFPNLSKRTRQTPETQEPESAPAAASKATPAPASSSATAQKPKDKISRELKRLQDTKEFAGIEDVPVVFTYWAKGKEVSEDESAPPTSRKAKAAPEPEPVKEELEAPVEVKQRRSKKYLDKGLYAGQEPPLHVNKGLSTAEKKKLATLPELIPSGKVNKTMPAPMFHGIRSLIEGRDFKLPFSICSPLPPGQPKPDEWKKMTKNRFIGDSKEYWRRQPHFHDYQSKCVCTPEDGCTESCQNRIMFYECDDTNCNAGRAHCQNRAFADLTTRRNKGGKYRVGVEVIKTSDRGYGVRSNRCFEPNQIIMEYAGEIITADECERRMREIYKDNECYYLMSFDQNMIIDATSGSIARFVNHSCNPNCRMTKWIVSGQPRMALFAGDRPIMTGEELTYDYNFDPFSAKHVQICLCGSHNCRGVLGPKSREPKPAKTNLQGAVKGAVKVGKRKLQELMGADEATKGGSGKKRKVQTATGVKGKLAGAGAKVAKGAATALKKGMSTITKNTKAALGTSTAANRRNVTATTGTILKKSATSRVVKVYGKTPVATKPRKLTVTSRQSNGTVTKGTAISRRQETVTETTTTMRKSGRVTRSPRKALENADLAAYDFGDE